MWYRSITSIGVLYYKGGESPNNIFHTKKKRQVSRVPITTSNISFLRKTLTTFFKTKNKHWIQEVKPSRKVKRSTNEYCIILGNAQTSRIGYVHITPSPNSNHGPKKSLKITLTDKYYGNLTSFGVQNLDALTQLTMQDYGHIGLHSMEDRKSEFLFTMWFKLFFINFIDG